MAVRRKVLLWVGVPLALLLLAGIFVWMVALSFRETQRGTLIFPDGSRLTVLGASLYGQPFTTDKPWQATLRRWLPAKWQGWLPMPVTIPTTPLPVTTYTSVSNCLWVWFTFVDASGTNSQARLLNGAPPWASSAPVSESGSRFDASAPSLYSVAAGATRVYWMPLYTFPRRQRKFDLQFFDKNGKLLGSASVPNPAKGPLPKWKPERLPLTRTNGPLVVTLESVTETPQGGPPFVPRVIPKYHLNRTDANWVLAGLSPQWSDATGNEAAPRAPLDYREKAWKLSLAFRQYRPSYSEAEGFVVSGLSVPEPGTLQVLTNGFERMGMKFTLHCLAGAGDLTVTNNAGLSLIGSNGAPRWATSIVRSGRSHSMPFFLLEGSQLGVLDEVHFRVIGAGGQVLPLPRADGFTFSTTALSSTDPATSPVSRTYLVEFNPANAHGTISLEVTISRPRIVEFIIDPVEIQRLETTNRLDVVPR